MDKVFIALGSNLGDRFAWLQKGVEGLCEIFDQLRCSPVYESVAHTLHSDDIFPDFLNAVVEVQTSIGAEKLLSHCQQIERRSKRQRLQPYGPRTLDLDLLVVGGIIRNTSQLVLPHPRILHRRFVLQPWYDLAPDYEIPSPVNSTVKDALINCKDHSHLVKVPQALKPSVSDTASK